MSEPDTIALAARAQAEEGLRSMLVGGNAVNPRSAASGGDEIHALRSPQRVERGVDLEDLPLNLPDFDSQPATAGLSNREAFRLSLRHALTFLPYLPPDFHEAPGRSTYPQRFQI